MKSFYRLLGTTAFASLLFAGPLSSDTYGAGGGNPPGFSNASENAFSNADAPLNVQHIARYTSGAAFDEAGTEIVKYNYRNGYAYSVNGAESALDIIDIAGQQDGNIELVRRIGLDTLGIPAGDITSVAVHPKGKYIAVSVPAEDLTEPGHVIFMDENGIYMNDLTVGSLPDMLTFTTDGRQLLVANEGEPSDDYQTNPEGSISIIDITGNPKNLDESRVATLPFTEDHVPQDVRIVGPDPKTDHLNMEPEFITVDGNDRFAYVSLQESNAIAKVDMQNKEISAVKSMGYKDHSKERNAMDPSDRDDRMGLRQVPVLGLYQPDGITSFEKDGETYILTANEGDAQDYDGYSEEARVADLQGAIELDAENYGGYTQEGLDEMMSGDLFSDENLGRLTVTKQHDYKDGSTHEAIVSFGGRSFSVLKGSDLSQIYDSGNEFESIILDQVPERFNGDFESAESFIKDDRSDNKGPEPESVEVGEVGGKTYAFIGLERTGGIMVYDVTDPAAPVHVQYIHDESNTDISPEGIEFISSQDSPTGRAMLMVANELSGTISTYSLQ
ncbi:choice-of-anchor I family protein [Salinicoccus bachuensis]|uniref:Choice-of-anchor I family protein n=1 Tax=Salinicoccus bachuensis TaxID=3136731 RepID=A0ABZ3CH62_9STAP